MGASNLIPPSEKWPPVGFLLFRNNTEVGSPRDFSICHPLVSESELGFPNQVPAFWPCANKMMSILLFLAERREDRGIRPHSLKATTIDVIMGEIVKGKANLSQLAAQGNYRAATAQDMGKVYSRNLAQPQQIFVSKFDPKIPMGDSNADSLTIDLPEFSAISQGDGTSLIKEVQGGRPADWAMYLSKDREQIDVLKKGRTILREAFLGNAIPGGQNENGRIVSQRSIAHVEKPRKQNEIIRMRSEDIECRNLCFPTSSLTEGESALHLFKLVFRAQNAGVLIVTKHVIKKSTKIVAR